MKRLVKLTRCLKGTPNYGVRMQSPRGWMGKVTLDMYSDTDFAGCTETRRAMTCGAYFLDKVPFSGFARRQGVQSTSSGEAEFYGATSVVMDGRLTKGLLEWLGYMVEYNLHLDSSAAKAMCMREGVGAVKHMDVRALWIQQERTVNNLKVTKVAGERNVADLGTKAHPRTRFEQLRDMASIVDCSRIDDYKLVEVSHISQEPHYFDYTEARQRGHAGNSVARAAQLMVAATAILAGTGVAASPVAENAMVTLATRELFRTEVAVHSGGLIVDLGWLTVLIMMVTVTTLLAQFWQWWHGTLMIPTGRAKTRTTGEEMSSGAGLQRTVVVQSQATYRWWKAKPESRALREREHGCWVD